MSEQTEQTPQTVPVQQVGMSESATCGLAYVTPIPAIIFLATAPYNQNPKIRFHSWQSIFLFIAAVAISVVLGIIWAIPGLNLINLLLQPLVSLAFFVVWLILMINAFNGKIIKLPVIADLSAKQAGMQL